MGMKSLSFSEEHMGHVCDIVEFGLEEFYSRYPTTTERDKEFFDYLEKWVDD